MLAAIIKPQQRRNKVQKLAKYRKYHKVPNEPDLILTSNPKPTACFAQAEMAS